MDGTLFNEKKEISSRNRRASIFLEFLHPDVNKGTGVKAIATLKNIVAHEVICVGDVGNDIAMIKYAGLGVAKVIEHFMLKKVIGKFKKCHCDKKPCHGFK